MIMLGHRGPQSRGLGPASFRQEEPSLPGKFHPMAETNESPKEHLDALLDETVERRRSLQEYEQQRVHRLRRYRDLRRQLEEAFARVWGFGNEQNRAGRKPSTEGFREWAERFVVLGRRFQETGHCDAIQQRLAKVARAGVPALDVAAELLLLSCAGNHDDLAIYLGRIHHDEDLRQFVLWLPYILDNLWQPVAEENGTIRTAEPPEGISYEDFRKAGEAFGWQFGSVGLTGLQKPARTVLQSHSSTPPEATSPTEQPSLASANETRGTAVYRQRSRRPRKRRDRAAKIERLTEEMIDHLKGAQNHATDTEARTGTPELLRRPRQKELAALTQMTATDVSRCFSDPAAQQLRLLWDMANDLDQIMKWSGQLGRRHRKR